MGYDRVASKRPVNLNLNSDLIEQCSAAVDNLSAHTEALLAADLEQRQAQANVEKVKIERAIDAFASLYEEHGSLSEEMQSL